MRCGAPRTPIRTCIGCRTARPQAELLRIAATPGGVRYDAMRRLPGRGAYVCPDPECIAATGRRDAGLLRRSLRTTDADGIRTALDALSRAPDAGQDHELCTTQAPGTGTVRSENA